MKKLPVDVSSFRIMITEGYIYVDKTKEIHQLISTGRFYFLSRPRRFGKSLLISTLKEIFSGNRSLFEGLTINKTDYVWDHYPVIDLNFSLLSFETSHELKISLGWTLDRIGLEHGIDVSKAPSPALKLEMLVIGLAAKKNKVVILIDEYDYPLINAIENKKIVEANRKILKSFFSAIKAMDEHLRAVFITGVSKFSKTSIFSGLNNLNDISLDPLADTLLGYTESEITLNLDDRCAALAAREGIQKKEIYQQLQKWYNGYRFSRSQISVYNPFSILYCLSKQNFENYWFASGTPTFLVELLKQNHEMIAHLEEVELSSDSLGAFDVGNLPLVTILFQTGYLTIKKYEEGTRAYTLGYPNYEVKESFKNYLLAAYVHSDVSTVNYLASQLLYALEKDNIELFCSMLNSLFAHIPYHLHIQQERYYHSLIQLIARFLGLDAQSEIATDRGRIDFAVSSKTHRYIFEFKFDVDAQAALDQIEDRCYFERYKLDSKKIVLVGLSFRRGKKGLILEHKIKRL